MSIHIFLELLTWTLKGLDQETSPDLNICIGDISKTRYFHLKGTPNNLVCMSPNHVGLICTSTTFSRNKYIKYFIMVYNSAQIY